MTRDERQSLRRRERAELQYHQGHMDAAAQANFGLGVKFGIVVGAVVGLVGGTFFGRWLQKQVP